MIPLGSITLNHGAIKRFQNSTMGPVGRHIARLADDVGTKASMNAQGAVIGVRSGRLLQGIRVRVDGTRDGVVGTVWTDAYARDRAGAPRLWNGRPFYYPSYHDVAGRGMKPGRGQKAQVGGQRPWLTNAMRDVFREAYPPL